MNDQQSSPVPDPYSQSSPSDEVHSADSSAPPPSDGSGIDGLSDQEAFLMLAMSMSDNTSGPELVDQSVTAVEDHGWAVEFTGDQPASDVVSEEVDEEANAEERHEEEGHRSMSADVGSSDERRIPPPVGSRLTDQGQPSSLVTGGESLVDLGAQSPLLAAMAGRLRGRRNGRSWATSAVSRNQWEVYDGCDTDDGAIHGQVTEVVDLSTVPLPPADVETAKAGLDTVPPPENEQTEHYLDLTAGHHELLPPETTKDDLDLPPLVFLNTQGDIMPSVRYAQPVDSPPPRVVVEWGEDGLLSTGEGVHDFDSAPSDTPVPADTVAQPEAGIEVEADDQLDLEALNTDGPDVDDVQAAAVESPSVAGPVVNVPISVSQGSDTEHVLDDAGRMFDQYCGPVIAVIASVAKDRRAIDEAIHETFLTAWESMDSFDPEEPRGPWMFTLARRSAFEQVAISQQLGLNGSEYPEPTHRETEVPVDQSWEAWEVRLAVDQLSATEYDVLRLTHREGLIHPEIASEMNTTVGAVKSRAYSGSHRLIELLDHVIRPDTEVQLDEDQASALTWYLAGVADGSDLELDERSAVKRVRNQLASSAAWIMPDTDARDHLLAVVAEAIRESTDSDATATSNAGDTDIEVPIEQLVQAEADPSSNVASSEVVTSQAPASDHVAQPMVREADPGSKTTGHAPQPEPTGEHRSITKREDETRPPITSIAVGLGLILVATLVMTNLFGILDADDGLARTYQLQPTDLDPDATAIVQLDPTDTGSRFEFEFGGLNPSADGSYYAVWLQRTVDGSVAPLGSFEWDVSGQKIVLFGPSGHDHYDLIVVTQSSRNAQAASDDPVVLTAAIE